MTDWTTHRALFTSLAVLLHGVIILVTAATFFPTPGVFNAALLTVTPSSLGPSVSMGLLRSCARSDRSALPTCTRPTIPPQYDLSALSATTVLDFGTPSRGFAIVVCIGLGLSALFSLTIMLVAVRFETHNKTQKLLPNSFWMGVIIGIGFFAACLPLVTMGLLRLRFDVIIKIFNASQDEFIARFGKLWILMTVGYLLLASSTAIVTAVRYRCIDPWPATGNGEFTSKRFGDTSYHGRHNTSPTHPLASPISTRLSGSTQTSYGVWINDDRPASYNISPTLSLEAPTSPAPAPTSPTLRPNFSVYIPHSLSTISEIIEPPSETTRSLEQEPEDTDTHSSYRSGSYLSTSDKSTQASSWA